MIQFFRRWFANRKTKVWLLGATLIIMIVGMLGLFVWGVITIFSNSDESSSNGPDPSTIATEGLADPDAQNLAVTRVWAPPKCATPTTQPITAPVPLGLSADELRSAGWKPVQHITRLEAAIGDFADSRARDLAGVCTSIEEARALALADLGLEAELKEPSFIVWQAPASLENPDGPAFRVYLSAHSSNFAFATVDTGQPEAAKAIIVVPAAPISAAALSSPDFAAAVDAAAKDLGSPGTGTSVPVDLVSPSGKALGRVNLWATSGVG